MVVSLAGLRSRSTLVYARGVSLRYRLDPSRRRARTPTPPTLDSGARWSAAAVDLEYKRVRHGVEAVQTAGSWAMGARVCVHPSLGAPLGWAWWGVVVGGRRRLGQGLGRGEGGIGRVEGRSGA